MAVAFIIIGVLINLIGGIGLLAKAFRESVWWGLAFLFIPFASIVFVVKFWPETKNPFLLALGGMALMVVGALVGVPESPADAATVAEQSAREEEAAEPPPRYEAAMATPPRNYTPPAYKPPHPPTTSTSVAEEKPRRLEQVYVDADNKVFYSEDCKKRPATAYKVAKSVATMQGYTAAPCS